MPNSDRRLALASLPHRAFLDFLLGRAPAFRSSLPPDVALVSIHQNFGGGGVTVLLRSEAFDRVPLGQHPPRLKPFQPKGA